MNQANEKYHFKAKLLRPANAGDGNSWGFVVLPKDVSEKLPRRGRTTIEGRINGALFLATLEPDGQLSHWLRVNHELQLAAGIKFGDVVPFEVSPVVDEPEPEIPADFEQALKDNIEAQDTWSSTTTIARVDWIHWVVSAKQPKTRAKRIADACSMLASGKKRVCCFDPSGFYSKAFHAPEAAD